MYNLKRVYYQKKIIDNFNIFINNTSKLSRHLKDEDTKITNKKI